MNDHYEKIREAALHPHPASRNQGLLQVLQEAAGKYASLGDTPAGKGGGALVPEALIGTEVAKRLHTHFTVEETETQRKEVTCSRPQSQRGAELVLAGPLGPDCPNS